MIKILFTFLLALSIALPIEFNPETGEIIKSDPDSTKNEYFDPSTGKPQEIKNELFNLNLGKSSTDLTVFDAKKLAYNEANSRFEKFIWTYGGGSICLTSNFFSTFTFAFISDGLLGFPAYALGFIAFPYLYSEFFKIKTPSYIQQKQILGIESWDNSEQSTLLINEFNKNYIKQTKKLRKSSLFWGQLYMVGGGFLGIVFISVIASTAN